MLEQSGNLWDLAKLPNILVISTNGFVKKNNECVMGRGIAKEAKEKFPSIALDLGHFIQESGNYVHDLGIYDDYYIYSFPVKHNWWEKADIKLIENSAKQLAVAIAIDFLEHEKIGMQVFIPQVGCGNGGLNWEDVKKIISPILDDRFIAVTF